MNTYKYQVTQTNLFKKQLKKAQKKGLNIDELEQIVTRLAKDEALPIKYKYPQKSKKATHSLVNVSPFFLSDGLFQWK